MRILPAIDIIEGQCVRLQQGDYSIKTVYNSNPVDVAIQFEEQGAKYLHLVDLDGAKASKILNASVIKDITAATNLIVDFGGGVKSDRDIELAFECGAAQVNCGSIAIDKPEIMTKWLKQYGGDKVILSADVNNGYVATHGWKKQSTTKLSTIIEAFIPAGLQLITCTDISKDGMLQGSNNTLYSQLVSDFPKLKFIASGGVTSLADIVSLSEIGVDGAIIGKSLYEGRITLDEIFTTKNTQ